MFISFLYSGYVSQIEVATDTADEIVRLSSRVPQDRAQ